MFSFIDESYIEWLNFQDYFPLMPKDQEFYMEHWLWEEM